MKVYLDDVRPTPEGYERCYWPEEVIALLKTGQVTALSLDHDLGEADGRNGYDVLLWLEEAVACEGFNPPAEILIHSANGPARQKMMMAVEQIKKLSCP